MSKSETHAIDTNAMPSTQVNSLDLLNAFKIFENSLLKGQAPEGTEECLKYLFDLLPQELSGEATKIEPALAKILEEIIQAQNLDKRKKLIDGFRETAARQLLERNV